METSTIDPGDASWHIGAAAWSLLFLLFLSCWAAQSSCVLLCSQSCPFSGSVVHRLPRVQLDWRQRSVNAFTHLSGIARKKSQCCHARPLTALRMLCDLREDDMSINIGDTIRLAETQEEGVVVATSNNTPDCVVVHFGNSFAYLIERKKLELVATRNRVRQRDSWTMSKAI